MNYFINFGMPASKSGIEHAQIKRKRLFDKHGEPYVFLLRDWERDLHTNTANAGITDDHLVNMFDYYQHACHVDVVRLLPEQVDLDLKIFNIPMITSTIVCWFHELMGDWLRGSTMFAALDRWFLSNCLTELRIYTKLNFMMFADLNHWFSGIPQTIRLATRNG